MADKRQILTGEQKVTIFMLCKIGVKQARIAELARCSVASVKRQWADLKAAVKRDTGKDVRTYKPKRVKSRRKHAV